MPLEKWVEFEKEINKRFGVDVNVFNPQGYRITEFKAWANKLCPAIKDTDKGQSFICATAHMNISAMAKNRKEPVLEECDAGLIKLVVPIFINDEFAGAVGACGHILDEGEVDTFLINKITEIEEETIEDLSKDIPYITAEKANDLTRFIEEKLEFMLRPFFSGVQV
jgi:ligand-binding sensor protein